MNEERFFVKDNGMFCYNIDYFKWANIYSATHALFDKNSDIFFANGSIKYENVLIDNCY